MSPILVVPPQIYPEQAPVHGVWRRRSWPVHQVASLSERLELPKERVRLYGDYAFCVQIALALRLELVSPPDDLLATLSAEWLQRHVGLKRLEDVGAADFPLFIKPVAPKLFQPRVYASRRELLRATQGLLPSTVIQISEAVTLGCEIRCLVRSGSVLDCALYEGEGSVSEAREFAAGFAASHNVAATYVLDVGEIEGSGWGVVEANAIWGAGLNGCDPKAMADCVLAATRVPPS